jgi:SOS response regulatory protein OraA/RecX
MLETILSASKLDERLAGLVDEAREYAQVYLLAKQRHKSCDGTGELMTLKEEFKDIVDKMIRYCQEKNYLSGDCAFDPDSVADALMRMSVT